MAIYIYIAPFNFHNNLRFAVENHHFLNTVLIAFPETPRSPRQVGDEAGAFPGAQFTPLALAKLMIEWDLVWSSLYGFNRT